MRLNVFWTIILGTWIFTWAAHGQTKIEKGYFSFPINPGQVNYLTGSMGELRPNHFHAGIDVKTNFQPNQPVYCSAEGYVSRIRVSSFGYGKVVYITHPNGYTTVYAHLDRFNDNLSKWVLKKQYELESFIVDLYPQKDELPVGKNEIIAISGNTGHSGGPHLHYEIRDQEERVWNPLLFGFEEIQDNVAPIFEGMALRTFGIDARLENEFGRKEFALARSGNHYTYARPIEATGLIGLEVRAHDRMNQTHNHYGISCIEMKVDGKETFFHHLTSFSFDETKKINAHIDYETMMQKKQRFQKCYVADGNDLSSYKHTPHNGKLNIEEGKSYKIEVIIYDSYGNNATLKFSITGKKPSYTPSTTATTSKTAYPIFENILKHSAPKSTGDSLATFYCSGKQLQIKPAYLLNSAPVYLYDLRNGLPDSIRTGVHTEYFHFTKPVYPGRASTIRKDGLTLSFPVGALIDTLYPQLQTITDARGQTWFELNDPAIPLFSKIEVTYTPSSPNALADGTYLGLYGKKYEDSEIKDGKLFAQIGYFGKFALTKDSILPVIRYLSHGPKSIRLSISDNDSGIDSFRATLDGQWLLMNYEHKNKTIWSENADPSKPLKGKFVLEVKDKAGNIKTFEKIL
jgi:hypothetical protein